MTQRNAGRRVMQPVMRPFNPSERRFVVQVALIGALVWAEVLPLKSSVHALFDLVMDLVAQSSSPALVLRETYEGGQILPGYSVRRFPVPLAWEGKTVIHLRVRNRFDLNVIGMIEAYVEDGRMRYQARFNPSIGRPLSTGDTLIVLGEDAKLDAFAATVDQENRTASP